MLALDPQSGKPLETPAEMLAIAARPESKAIEGAFIVRKQGFYYLFVSFDLCGRGVESTYKIMVGRSWDLNGPYRDRSGKAMMEGGGTLVLESHDYVRGPGHNSVLLDGEKDWLVHHYYDARAKGVPTLQIRPLVWANDEWPLAGDPIGGPQTAQRPKHSTGLPEISDFQRHPSDRFLVDLDDFSSGHPFKGVNSIQPHAGAGHANAAVHGISDFC